MQWGDDEMGCVERGGVIYVVDVRVFNGSNNRDGTDATKATVSQFFF